MKNSGLHFLAFIFLLLTCIRTIGQDERSGWFADGVKVDRLTCYSFGSFQVAVPYKSEWEVYEFISVHIYKGKSEWGGVKMIPIKAINNYIKGTTLVYTIYKDNDISFEEGSLLEKGSYSSIGVHDINISGQTEDFYLYRWMLKYEAIYMGKARELPDEELNFDLYGVTQTGIKEEFSPTCNCIKKTPQYSTKKLTKTYKLVCTGRTQRKAKEKLDPAEFTVPCSYPGTKIDFNSSSTSGSSLNSTNNSNTNSASINNTSAKTTAPVKTSSASGKTIITAVAPTSASAIKPLDKTKPGYFEEKSDDKKFMYRNGYQTSPGVYHGEVREYESNALEKIIIYTNGIEDGLYVIFSDGKIEWNGNYKNGKKDGAWKHYKNGVLEETEKYINGEKQN